MKIPVLLFHDVSPEAAGKAPNITITPERFREIVAWLADHGYTGVSARDCLQGESRREAISGKPVVITFDDAYASIAEHALPVLKSYGFRATVFVVTSLIGRTNEWDTPKWRALPLMDADQIRAWAACGIEFGSHSCRHYDLTTLGESELRREIAPSHDELANVTGEPVVSFAYPFGEHNRTVRRVVAQTFPLAFTTYKGVVTPNTDPMLCARIEIMPNHTARRVGLYLQFAEAAGLWGRMLRSARPLVRQILSPRPGAVQP
jgi:peptidoglycan/xylan/chitin deacetylase (PgdA/CDA1 family)